MEEKIKVIIAEDIEPIRQRYASILNNDPEITVVADVSNGMEAHEKVIELEPDVVLMDIEMETKDAGIRATGNILGDNPDIKIIILTVHEEDDMIFSALQLGASDYILKNATNEEIVAAVKAAYYGASPIRAEIASKVRSEFRRVKSYESSFLYVLNICTSLTPSELDTLYLLSCGHSRKDICQIRCVEMSTVKSLINRILKKFNKRKISEIIQSETDLKLLESIIKNFR